jgi:AcrR family transcriptional regulator
VPSTRSYNATRRREQARRTRQRIVAIAGELFSSQGYGATSIAAIADAAGVSDQTIYKTFENKRQLLREVIATAVEGDEHPVPLLEQPWVAGLRAEPHPAVRLRLMVTAARRVYERTATIQRVVAEAATVDPAIAEMLAEHRIIRLHDIRELLRLVSDDGTLLGGCDLDEATEYVWAVMSPDVYELTVEQRAWTPQRWEAWLHRTLTRVVLSEPPTAR